MADNKRDYYEVLGLKKGASDDQIKKAYRQMAKKISPPILIRATRKLKRRSRK